MTKTAASPATDVPEVDFWDLLDKQGFTLLETGVYLRTQRQLDDGSVRTRLKFFADEDAAIEDLKARLERGHNIILAEWVDSL